jgi:hypothetical protein
MLINLMCHITHLHYPKVLAMFTIYVYMVFIVAMNRPPEQLCVLLLVICGSPDPSPEKKTFTPAWQSGAKFSGVWESQTLPKGH